MSRRDPAVYFVVAPKGARRRHASLDSPLSLDVRYGDKSGLVKAAVLCSEKRMIWKSGERERLPICHGCAIAIIHGDPEVFFPNRA